MADNPDDNQYIQSDDSDKIDTKQNTIELSFSRPEEYSCNVLMAKLQGNALSYEEVKRINNEISSELDRSEPGTIVVLDLTEYTIPAGNVFGVIIDIFRNSQEGHSVYNHKNCISPWLAVLSDKAGSRFIDTLRLALSNGVRMLSRVTTVDVNFVNGMNQLTYRIEQLVSNKGIEEDNDRQIIDSDES
ncbi:MAG: hypothetical protein Q9M91_05955 [Candidatus Dojkabacteria bacterium]|nr:hypothetical protein [Candidatus Dojkabacteria bacterium]MDQ7021343.1 hypothetical protein [Candidatus Dojkabacteria bacterium]